MTDKLPTPEEREFLTSIGLEPNNLAPLVEDAPQLSPDTLERIHSRARQKAELTSAIGAPTTTVISELPAPPPVVLSRRPRWWIAAAAALLLVGGTLFAANPEGAMAAIQRLVRLVPGIGLTETDGETLVMVSPVSAESNGQRLTVTGLISDGEWTEVRYVIEGLPRVKWDPDEGERPAKPSLRLPDGTLLESTSSLGHGGSGTYGGTIWFAALPVGTTELTLSLPSRDGQTQAFEVAIPVVEAETAGLAEANLGSWSVERLGVRVGVPHWTSQGDRVILNLDASLPEGMRLAEVGASNETLQFAPVLTDEQGRVYPLITRESILSPGSLGPASVTFQGPLAPDAGRLRLSVPVLRVAERAEVSLSVPVSKIPVGRPLQLDEQLKIGSRSFMVNMVTRKDEETFQFDLDLGPEEDGVLLQELRIRPKQDPFGGGGGWGSATIMDPESWQVDWIEYNPDDVPERTLEVVFSEAVIRLQGEWEIELPDLK